MSNIPKFNVDTDKYDFWAEEMGDSDERELAYQYLRVLAHMSEYTTGDELAVRIVSDLFYFTGLTAEQFSEVLERMYEE